MTARKQIRFIFIIVFFSLIVLEKKDRKHFPVYIKVKKKLFDVDECVLERFLKLQKLKCLNRKTPLFISTSSQTTRKHLQKNLFVGFQRILNTIKAVIKNNSYMKN